MSQAQNFNTGVTKRYEKSPGSAPITNRRHQEEEEPDKTKQAQIKQTYEKHYD